MLPIHIHLKVKTSCLIKKNYLLYHAMHLQNISHLCLFYNLISVRMCEIVKALREPLIDIESDFLNCTNTDDFLKAAEPTLLDMPVEVYLFS